MTKESNDSTVNELFGQVTLVQGLPEPWCAYLLPVVGYPLSAVDLERCSQFRRVLQRAVESRKMVLETFISVWKLGEDNGSLILQKHMQLWDPTFGMGIWPSRKSPEGWTQDDLMNAAAAVMRGEEPDLPVYRLLRLAGEQKERSNAASQLEGKALLIQAFHQQSWKVIEQQMREVYLPKVLDPGLRREDFYLPLLDIRDLSTPEISSSLLDLLGDISLYIRESAEDKGLLVLSKGALDLHAVPA